MAEEPQGGSYAIKYVCIYVCMYVVTVIVLKFCAESFIRSIKPDEGFKAEVN